MLVKRGKEDKKLNPLQLFMFHAISTLAGYLMSNPVYIYIWFVNQ